MGVMILSIGKIAVALAYAAFGSTPKSKTRRAKGKPRKKKRKARA